MRNIGIDRTLPFFLGACLFLVHCHCHRGLKTEQLDKLKNVVWRITDTSRTGMVRFSLTDDGNANVNYYDSAGVLKIRRLRFDHELGGVPIFNDCADSQCAWLTVINPDTPAALVNFCVIDSRLDYDSLLKTSVFPYQTVGGSGGGGAPGPIHYPGQCAIFSSVSCCINKDHPQHHCAKTMDELSALHKKYGCVFD